MTKRLQALIDKIEADPKRRARVDKYERVIDTALALGRLRESQSMTQRELAARMGMAQSNISRIEREDDVYLSTLRAYIENLGGHLEINAVFDNETITLGPDGLQVRPTTFKPIGKPQMRPPTPKVIQPLAEWLDGQLAPNFAEQIAYAGTPFTGGQGNPSLSKGILIAGHDVMLGGAVQQTLSGSNHAVVQSPANANALVA